MSKFIQTHFFHPSIFSLPTKQKEKKLKSFLSSHFSILPPFSILPLFHPSNQTDPKEKQRCGNMKKNFPSPSKIDTYHLMLFSFSFLVGTHDFAFITIYRSVGMNTVTISKRLNCHSATFFNLQLRLLGSNLHSPH